MNPIKVLFLTFCLFAIISARGQHPSVTFFGGANVASMSIEHGSTTTQLEDTYGMLYGFNIGALYDYVFKKDRSKELSLESGLVFDSRGFTQNLEVGELQQDNKTTLYYIDIPLYLKYIFRLRSRDKIYFGAGPYMGVGLFGNYIRGENEPETISWGSDSSENDYKRLDYGLTGKIGYLAYSGFNISVSYDYGLPNISAVETKGYKNRLMRLSLGYTLKFDD